jgi:hypothetical protein
MIVNFDAYVRIIRDMKRMGPGCNLLVQPETESNGEKFPNLEIEVDINVTLLWT